MDVSQTAVGLAMGPPLSCALSERERVVAGAVSQLVAAASTALCLDPVATEALLLRGAGDPVLDREANRAVGGVAQTRQQASARLDGRAARQLHEQLDLAPSLP